jgi:hypothetical protein
LVALAVRCAVLSVRALSHVAVSTMVPGSEDTIVTAHVPSARVTHDPVVPDAGLPLIDVKWPSVVPMLSERLTVSPARPVAPVPSSRVSLTVKVCGWPRSFTASIGLALRLKALYCLSPVSLVVNGPEASVVPNVAVSRARPGVVATMVTEQVPFACVVQLPVVPLAEVPLIAVRCASLVPGSRLSESCCPAYGR